MQNLEELHQLLEVMAMIQWTSGSGSFNPNANGTASWLNCRCWWFCCKWIRRCWFWLEKENIHGSFQLTAVQLIILQLQELQLKVLVMKLHQEMMVQIAHLVHKLQNGGGGKGVCYSASCSFTI